ncbi:MAG: 1-phosphofructokinase family hexose kinase [Oscillospiraceae bacterium]|nr:1-phosphofructokinase family hexose kinase [Oscillospiraceae bacterium]
MDTDLVLGKVNRPRTEVIYPGGKGINVSLALRQLGEETKALGFAAGRIGQTIRDMLDDLQCPHNLLDLGGGRQSRINVKFKGNPETAVNGFGPLLAEEDMVRLLDLLRGVKEEDMVVLSGWTKSIPFYVSILRQVSAAGCLTVLDCTGEALWQCLSCRPFLIKPNLAELGALFGVEDLELMEGVDLARQLQREGARNVLVTMGGGGAFLLTEEQELYSANACIGQVRNTVGAGDSLIAGFLTGWKRTGDYSEALRLGVAAGCATAFSDWLGTKSETMELLDQIQVQRVPIEI